MLSDKYKNILKVSIIVIAIAIIALAGYIGITKIKLSQGMKQANEFVAQFANLVAEKNKTNENVDSSFETTGNSEATEENSAKATTLKYKENEVAGIMQIAKISLNIPILIEEKVSTVEETAGILTGAGLNNIGNTVIVGQSYFKNMAFHDIEKLALEDLIKITDINGTEKTYTINNIYKTDKSDKKYIIENSQGNTRITLITYTNNEILVVQADAK